MSVNSQSLFSTIRGLHKDYGNTEAPKCLEFMPAVDQDSLAAQYLVADQDIFPDARDPVSDAAPAAQFKLLSSTYSRESIAVAIKQGFAEVIPERVTQGVDSLAGVDLVNRSLRKVLHKQWDQVLADVLTAADTLSATTAGSGTLALNAQADLQKFFNTAIEDIHVATGDSANLVLYIPQPVALALLNQDQIYRGPGIAVGANTVQRRLDAAPMSAIDEFFATKLSVPVRVIVERFIRRSTANALGYRFSTGLYLAAADGPEVDAWGKFIYQSVSGATSQDGPVAVYTADVGPQQLMEPGTLVAGAGAWKAQVTSSAKGVKAATTLP